MVFRSFFQRSQGQKKLEDTSKILGKIIDNNIEQIQKTLDKPDDLVIRRFVIGPNKDKCAVIYMDGLVDTANIQENILENLQIKSLNLKLPNEIQLLFHFINEELLTVGSMEEGQTLEDVVIAILSGETVFFLDGINQALIMDTKGGDFRAIAEPITETLIRGPREGFVENIGTNISLIRRRLKDPNLRFKSYKTGRRSRRNLIVSYIDGIINPTILKEVERRLKTINMDDLPESGYIEEWIEDSFLSPFPQTLNTERPDKVVSALLQGKVAIFLQGTPFVLIIPVTFGDILRSPEDYYERWTIGTLLRLLRFLGAFISIFLPPLYIALISYHPDMIPSLLAFSIASTREGVPFPAVIEAFLMVITMELLQEAGARLPQTIGQTIGIVGGLVIGEAAVRAGIVSPVMVIVIALTAIATFTIPAYSFAISFRIIRFAFMFAAATLGLYGIVLVYIIINIHIVNLKSFGVPFSAPFAPFFKKDWNDLVIRGPLSNFTYRPQYLQPEDDIALNKGEKQS